MKNIQEIHDEWDADSQINSADLGGESLKIPILTAKYDRIRTIQKAKLISLEAKLKELKGEKREFLVNPTQDKIKRGWELPSQGRLLKSEVKDYLESDKDIVQAEIAVAAQYEVVYLLDRILKSLYNRGFLIKNAIEDRKFMSGG